MFLKTKHGVMLPKDYNIDFSVAFPNLSEKLYISLGKKSNNPKITVTKNTSLKKYDKIAELKNNVFIYSPENCVFEDVKTLTYKNEEYSFAVLKNIFKKSPSFSVLNLNALNQKENAANYGTLKTFFAEASIINDYSNKYLCDCIDENKPFKKILLNCSCDQLYDISAVAAILNFETEVLEGLDIMARLFNASKEICLVKNYKTKSVFKNFKKEHKDIKLIKTNGKYPVSCKLNEYAEKENCIILGPECLKAVYRAVNFGEPQTTKLLTVWGNAIYNPAFLLCPLGTPIYHLLNFCNSQKQFEKLISGNIMTGFLTEPEDPVTIYTNSVIALKEKENIIKRECINCGKCLDICPKSLTPFYILKLINGEGLTKVNFKNCINCGCCDYICPAKIPLRFLINRYNQNNKTEIKAENKNSKNKKSKNENAKNDGIKDKNNIKDKNTENANSKSETSKIEISKNETSKNKTSKNKKEANV